MMKAQSHVALRAVLGRRVQSGGGQDCGCPVPPHPSPLPEEREGAWTALENSDVAVAVPASLSFVSEAHDNQARSYYQSTAECFSLSLRERVGVTGNRTPAILDASALDFGV